MRMRKVNDDMVMRWLWACQFPFRLPMICALWSYLLELSSGICCIMIFLPSYCINPMSDELVTVAVKILAELDNRRDGKHFLTPLIICCCVVSLCSSSCRGPTCSGKSRGSRPNWKSKTTRWVRRHSNRSSSASPECNDLLKRSKQRPCVDATVPAASRRAKL